MKAVGRLVTLLAALGLAPVMLRSAPAIANSLQTQNQAGQSSASKTKAAHKKSSSEDLSQDQGGARDFKLPGDSTTPSEPQSKKPATKAKTPKRPPQKASPNPPPKPQS